MGQNTRDKKWEKTKRKVFIIKLIAMNSTLLSWVISCMYDHFLHQIHWLLTPPQAPHTPSVSCFLPPSLDCASLRLCDQSITTLSQHNTSTNSSSAPSDMPDSDEAAPAPCQIIKTKVDKWWVLAWMKYKCRCWKMLFLKMSIHSWF